MFVTFYSYKGGVGRSLAIANIACLMAEDDEHPQKVLVWDFDLEAPGLHRLFPPKQPMNYGFVDFVYEYAVSGNVPEIADYIYESEIKGVHVLPAGKVGETYCDKLQKINWPALFGSNTKEPGPFFGKLLKDIRQGPKPFDYILVDSRTGLNDQAGICTQVLSDFLIVLFRLSAQNMDGLTHLVPAIKSQLKMRGKEDVQVLPVASQVGAVGSEGELAEIRKNAMEIFGKKLEYIRFNEDLVSREKLFCLRRELETLWPCPPIVDDYRRICLIVREHNEHDTETQARELRSKVREGDSATASTILLRLLPRRPRLRQAWNSLARLFDDRMPELRRKEFKRIVSRILREDPTNFFAHQWRAAFKTSEASSPEGVELIQAKKFLNRALKHAPDAERGNIYRVLGSIDSCRGDHEGAIKALRNAQALLPKNNQISLDLAMIHMRMGAKYFAVACEELEQIPGDVGVEKHISLAYLRAFLGETKKATDALKSCSKEMKPLVQAHMLLIQGDKKKGIKLAEETLSSRHEPLDLANWAEFYLCSQDFERALSLAEEASKGRRKSLSEPSLIKNLVNWFRRKKQVDPGEMDKLIASWGALGWSFRELLMFRECCIRDGKNYGWRFDVIEKLIRLQEFRSISRFGIGISARKPIFREIRIPIEPFA